MKKTLALNINARLNNFDTIRLFAALIVMFSHSFQITGFLDKEPLMVFSKDYMYFGRLSVIIFFVISGFLITGSFHRSKNLKSFLMARILRIYPALIVVVFLSVFCIGSFITVKSYKDYFNSQETYKYLLSGLSLKIYENLPGVFLKNPVNVVNGPLWTLPYELSCYSLVAMIGLLKAAKFKNSILLLLFTVLVYLCVGISEWKTIFQFTLYFAIGSFFYLMRNKIVLNHVVALVLFCILFYVLHLNASRHFKDLVLCIALPYIIMDIAFIKSKLSSIAKYGDFSYGIYIYGWLVQQVIYVYFPILSPLSSFVISLFITIVIAFLSWHLVEKRFLKFKKYFK